MKLSRKNDVDVDMYDIDRQQEAWKGNYIVGNDQEGYRISVNGVVEMNSKSYRTEDRAMEGLFEHLCDIEADVELLPSYEELSGGRKPKNF